MESEDVSRSRVFREAYLPGAYVRLRNQAYARVDGVRTQASALDGVDMEQLREAVLNYLNDWEAEGGTVDAAFKLAAQKKNLVIQSPSELFVTPAPIMIRCRTCNVIDFYDTRADETKEIEKMSRRIRSSSGRAYIPCKRPGCSGHMVQIPYAAVHRCGYTAALYVHHSARRATNIGFSDGGSFLQSSYFDVDKGEKLAGALQDDCPSCKSAYPAETNKRGTPLTNGESFYSQSTQYIALSEDRGRLIARLLGIIKEAGGSLTGAATDIAEGIASCLVGKIGSRNLEARLKSMLLSSIGDIEAQNRLREKLEKKRDVIRKFEAMKPLDDALNEMLESTKEELLRIEGELLGASGGFSEVRTLIPDDETLRGLIRSRRSLEATFLPHDVNSLAVETAIDRTADLVQRETLAQQWQIVQERYGIASIAHIPDLLVVLSTLGFSREKSSPKTNAGTPPVNLNAFSDRVDSSMRGKIPIYAMSARTEALWIKLDPRKVLAWCIASANWDPIGADVLASREKSHAHLLRHSPALSLHPAKVAHETASDPKRAGAPFHLLHTLSHALILTARRHTGYDSKSIQEYLLPMDLSVILYVASVQNYTSGGLLTLFHHYLLPWFDDASMFAFNCPFDPVCTDAGGSCSGCVQTEIGCESFNHGLSRSYLHGGAIDREASLTITQGFWDAPR